MKLRLLTTWTPSPSPSATCPTTSQHLNPLSPPTLPTSASSNRRANNPAPQVQARPPPPPLGTNVPKPPVAPAAPTLTPHGQPSADTRDLDPSIHYPFYDTTLKKLFGNPELYAQAFPHCWEASQLHTGKYNLSSFTPIDQHPDYRTKYLPSYAQAADSARGPKKG